MAKKMTIVERYAAIVAKYAEVMSDEDKAFLNERAELHAKKNASRKPTKAQAENENIKAEILDTMESGKAYTVSEIQKMVGLETNQKTSALVRQLTLAELVTRSVEKGKAYFTKVD